MGTLAEAASPTGIMDEPILRAFMPYRAASEVDPAEIPGRWIAEAGLAAAGDGADAAPHRAALSDQRRSHPKPPTYVADRDRRSDQARMAGPPAGRTVVRRRPIAGFSDAGTDSTTWKFWAPRS